MRGRWKIPGDFLFSRASRSVEAAGGAGFAGPCGAGLWLVSFAEQRRLALHRLAHGFREAGAFTHNNSLLLLHCHFASNSATWQSVRRLIVPFDMLLPHPSERCLIQRAQLAARRWRSG